MTDVKRLEEILSKTIQNYKDSGFLGDSFDQVKSLQDERTPKYVSESIKTFIKAADGYIAEITTIVKEPEVNYKQLKYLAECVYESNLCSFGGSLVNNASLKLVAASEAKNKEECVQSLEAVNREYETLKKKLDMIDQLEKAIYYQKHKDDKDFFGI